MLASRSESHRIQNTHKVRDEYVKGYSKLENISKEKYQTNADDTAKDDGIPPSSRFDHRDYVINPRNLTFKSKY